jgi:hypothetical protein
MTKPELVRMPPRMLLRVEDHANVEDLCSHYRRSGFDATSLGLRMIEVSKPDPVGPAEERHAILGHLAVWRTVVAEALD